MTEEWRDAFKAIENKYYPVGQPINYLKKEQVDDILAFISQQRKEAARKAIGKIGAKLLANHSPQAVLDAYFKVANELIEEYEEM